MSDEDALFTIPPSASPGMHPATVTAVVPVTVDTAEGPKRLIRWGVAIETEEGVAEHDSLSSLLFTPRSKARRWAMALGVPSGQKEVRAVDLVGRECMVLLVQDDQGYTKLDDILPMPSKKVTKP